MAAISENHSCRVNKLTPADNATASSVITCRQLLTFAVETRSSLLGPKRAPASRTDLALDHFAGIGLGNKLRAVGALPGAVGVVLIFRLFFARLVSSLGARVSTAGCGFVRHLTCSASTGPGTILAIVPVTFGKQHGSRQCATRDERAAQYDSPLLVMSFHRATSCMG